MGESERMWIGGAMIAIGIIGLVTDVVKRRGTLAYLLSLAWVAIGAVILLIPLPVSAAWAAVAVTFGWLLFVAVREKQWDEAWNHGWMTVIGIGFLGSEWIPQLHSISIVGVIAILANILWRFFSTPDTRMAKDDSDASTGDGQD